MIIGLYSSALSKHITLSQIKIWCFMRFLNKDDRIYSVIAANWNTRESANIRPLTLKWRCSCMRPSFVKKQFVLQRSLNHLWHTTIRVWQCQPKRDETAALRRCMVGAAGTHAHILAGRDSGLPAVCASSMNAVTLAEDQRRTSSSHFMIFPLNCCYIWPS